MKILVITPHPDDEVLGCGGTIKKYSQQKNEVYLCIVTKAYTPDWTNDFIKNRKKEIAEANKVLGIKKSFFLDLPTARLDTISQKKLNNLISKCVNKIKPEVVYIPYYGDLNNDHRLIFKASMVAVRPKPGSVIRKVLCYEVLSETEWAGPFLNSMFTPNVYIDISSTLKEKLKAMFCYKTELKDYPHPRSLKAINALVQKRGSEAGLEAAEAFMLIREIHK